VGTCICWPTLWSTPPVYRRLAKLLLLVTQTREVRRLLEEKFFLEIPKCRTMVFTDKPVSMKYRGLL